MEPKSPIQSMPYQALLFGRLSALLPKHLSLADEVAATLGISIDRAYRRISCKKQLSLDEFFQLCDHYNLNPSEIAGFQKGLVCFHSYLLNEKTFRFEDLLVAIRNELAQFSKAAHPELIFMLNELNILHLVQIPELLAFKLFYWAKSNMKFSDYHDKLFSIEPFNEDIKDLAEEIAQIYVRIPSIELFTHEMLSSIVKQIGFYNESGVFENPGDPLILCEKILVLLEHQKAQAELGYKYVYGHDQAGDENNFQAYVNEMVLTDNTIVASSEQMNVIFITANSINLMFTDNPDYHSNSYMYARNIIDGSTLISLTGERERNRFFRGVEENVARLRNQLITG